MAFKFKTFAAVGALIGSLALVGCGQDEKDPNHIKVGVIVGAEQQVAEVAQKVAKEKYGLDVELVTFNDYVLPNEALSKGDIDANAFQHKPYLDTFKKENNLDLVEVFQVPTAPLGIYSGKKTTLDDVYKGMRVSAPNDPSNFARALVMMDDLGWITLKDNIDPLTASKTDIADNSKYDIEIIELEAAQLPRARDEVDFAVINGNYASGAGIGDKVLTTEDAESVAAQTFGNVISVKEGRENEPAVQALVAVLMSEDVQAWIEANYNGVVMPMGAQALDIPEITEPVTLKVGASPSPHAEILEYVKPILAEHNVELDIVEFDDYVMPNTGVEDGSLDANYFQHQPYLDDFNAQQGTHIVSVATVHYEPMGVYPGKTASLDVFKK